MEGYHIPVLLDEVIEGLNINPDGVYVDLTFGGGGHSKVILEKLSKKGRLFGFDQDLDAKKNALQDKRFTFVRGNFRYLTNFMRYYDIEKVDGILADLGVSSHHFDDESRGFSFRFEAPLDMRMNQKAAQSAADILNKYSQESLSDIFYLYGEIKQSRKVAAAIVNARKQREIKSIGEFCEIITPFLDVKREKKDMARFFQALRIEVNREMDALEKMLIQTPDILSENGRLAIITYHSLEDRMVKNFIRTGSCSGKEEKDFYGKRIAPLEAVNNKVIIPTDVEQERNPRSRSAKLRIAQLTR